MESKRVIDPVQTVQQQFPAASSPPPSHENVSTIATPDIIASESHVNAGDVQNDLNIVMEELVTHKEKLKRSQAEKATKQKQKEVTTVQQQSPAPPSLPPPSHESVSITATTAVSQPVSDARAGNDQNEVKAFMEEPKRPQAENAQLKRKRKEVTGAAGSEGSGAKRNRIDFGPGKDWRVSNHGKTLRYLQEKHASHVELPLHPDPHESTDYRYLRLRNPDLYLSKFLDKSLCTLSTNKRKRLCQNLVKIVAEVHKYKVAHRNINPESFCVYLKKDDELEIESLTMIGFEKAVRCHNDDTMLREDQYQLAKMIITILKNENSNWNADKEMQVLVNDLNSKIKQHIVCIKSVQDLPLIWTCEQKVLFVVHTHGMLNQLPDMRSELNRKGEKFKISSDKYPSFWTGTKWKKVRDLKYHDGLIKKMNNMGHLIKLIRNLFNHGDDRRYPEIRQWVGATGNGKPKYVFETFWTNVTGPWPEFLLLLFNRCNLNENIMVKNLV